MKRFCLLAAAMLAFGAAAPSPPDSRPSAPEVRPVQTDTRPPADTRSSNDAHATSETRPPAGDFRPPGDRSNPPKEAHHWWSFMHRRHERNAYVPETCGSATDACLSAPCPDSALRAAALLHAQGHYVACKPWQPYIDALTFWQRFTF